MRPRHRANALDELAVAVIQSAPGRELVEGLAMSPYRHRAVPEHIVSESADIYVGRNHDDLW